MRKALTKDINRLLMYDSNVDESGAQLFHTDEEKISYDQEICHNSKLMLSYKPSLYCL